MTETQKRIRAYKRALPHMRERVTAVLLLLVMSISMLTSATFAWITLSRSPEVSGLGTTIATNGNLEIALSDTDGLQPDESAIGDGGQDVTLSNLTWGNLVNLSHESYGLEKLTLRPAILNSGSLLDSPLYSVEYGSDGRITKLISDFAFTNYGTKDGVSAFFVPENGETAYGVRAISSVTYSSVTGDAMLIGLSSSVTNNQGYAIQSFQQLYGNKNYMSSITGLAGVYLQYRMQDVDQNCNDYVEVLYKMFDEYEDTLILVGDTLLAMANLHHFVYCNKNNETYTAFTLEQLNTGVVQTVLAAEGITLSAMAMYLSDYKVFFGTAAAQYTDGLWPRFQENIYNVWAKNGTIGWETLRDYINPMADINTATINGTQAQSLGASDLASVALSSSKVCVLHKGLIKNMDKMLGTELSITNVNMNALGFNVTLTEIKTDAEEPYTLQADVKQANQKAQAGGLAARDAVAADTYGMALDLWVRTNAADSLLILEGELITETVETTDGEGNTIIETKTVGYSGVNRVWEEEDPDLPVLGTSVTQGSGSCYIFYPDSPEDQAQALQMLRAMCVAFVDGEGNLLAQADMDVDNAIESGGRVLVPLKLRAKSIQTEDENGNTVTETSYHITELEQNVATQITAIVYMDGSRLTNSEVLSAGSIKGQLNIQFGTTENMVSLNNRELKDDYYNIIVSVADSELTYDPNNLPKTTVTLILNGMEASSIQANFISYVSQTQGSRQPSFTFTNTSGSEWQAEVTFTGPGTYQLRSVQIDGVDYALTEEQMQDTVVYIPGISVASVSCSGWDGASSYSYMTADGYYQLEMEMDLNVGEGMSAPRVVQGVFAHEDGQNVTVTFTQTNEGWKAKANFTTSGTYTLTYVIIDGTYVALSTTQYKTLTLNLGMQARIFITQPATQDYLDELDALNTAEAAAIAAVTGTDEEKAAQIEAIRADYDTRRAALLAELNGEDGLKMTTVGNSYQFEYDGVEPLFMDVSVIITDDQGVAMTTLSNLKLHYGIGASVANRLDTNLTWNVSTNRYEGDFQLTKPGTYTFQNLEVGSSTIYSATNAPRIAAIAKTPISYVGKSADYVEELTNISSTATRYMSVVLADSPSAEVKLVLQHTELDENGNRVMDANGEDSYTYTIERSTADGSVLAIDNQNDTYTYMVNVPEDGTWEIVGMYVSQAYYDGVYYDGAEGEGATGWLDLSEEVLADDIITTFFTTVKFRINNQPSSNQLDGEFMEDHIVKNLTITLTDYLDNAIEGADVSMSYKWNPTTLGANYSLLSGTPANTEFSNITTTDGKNFVMEDMNFQLDGQYVGSFAITINGTEYSQTDFTRADDTTVYTVYTVYWDQPEVKITGVSTDTYNGVELPNSELYDGVQNYYEDYYANTYLYASGSFFGQNSFTASSVQMSLVSGMGNAASAKVTVGNSSYSTTYTLNSANSWSASNTIGATTNAGYTRQVWGTLTASQIILSDGTVDFTFTLPSTKKLTINNAAYPHYLTLSADTTKVDMPSTITCTNYKGDTFTVNTDGASSVQIFSPDGRAFKVKLPAMTKSVDYTTSVWDYSSEIYSPNEEGTATTTVGYYNVKSSSSGCNTTYSYDVYTLYTRTATASGTKYYYTDTFTVSAWSLGAVNETVTVSQTTTTTATITMTTVETGTEKLTGESRTQYCYKFTETKTGQSSSVTENVTEDMMTWYDAS